MVSPRIAAQVAKEMGMSSNRESGGQTKQGSLLPHRMGGKPDFKALTALAEQRRESVHLEADLIGESGARPFIAILPVD